MNSWTLNPETERIRKERNAEAHAGSRQLGARKHRLLGHNGSGSGDAREASPLATHDGIGGTPSPVSKDVDVGGDGSSASVHSGGPVTADVSAGTPTHDADIGGDAQQSSARKGPLSCTSAADVSAQHAYHQWQEHFWGARERTFNRLGIRER